MNTDVQQNALRQRWIILVLIFGLIFILFFIAVILSLGLLSIYLPNGVSDRVVYNNTTLTSFRATYRTNIFNASEMFIRDSISLATSLDKQLYLPNGSTVNIILSQFMPVSAYERKQQQQQNRCTCDTNDFMGDYYIVEAQINSSQTVASAVQTYSTLNLPFKSLNGSSVNISMTLCNYEQRPSISLTCFDNIRNMDETDIDCGGKTCSHRCNIHQKCHVTSDCNNAACVAGICVGESEKILAVCRLIQQKISTASQVFYPYEAGYNRSISHFATSSTTLSVCSVQPGTVKDVRIVLSIIAKFRIPFGIKGGGHIQNPGFSSTTGILIAMSRFKQVTYHANNQTVDIGAGLLWDDVYHILDPFNVTVVGGRVSGVGVAGLLLGGGYSWKSNQYGLSIDTILEYELTTPNSTVVYVNNVSYPDLFFGLKGGFNNFGIVTRFTMRAVPQTQVYGGFLYYSPVHLNALTEAMIIFQTTNQDPKAQILTTLIITPGLYLVAVFLFYDAPIAPTGIFDHFINIEHFGTVQTQSYSSFINVSPVSQSKNLRSRYSSVSVTRLSGSLLATINNQLVYANSTLGSKSGALFIFSIEPFLPSYFNRSQGGAYPHVPSLTAPFPIALQFSWLSPSDDEIFINGIKSTTDTILQAALDDGQDIGGSKQIIYPNSALESTSLEQMYGNHVARLRSIRKAWDPNNIMYLAGGFKF